MFPATFPKTYRDVCRVVAISIAALGLAGPTIAQAAEPADPGRQWALLIGCEKYHRATQLKYTVNDVHQLSETLRTWGGYPKECVLEITDEAKNPRFQPLKASLEAELPVFLKKLGPNDTLLLYFSGHGERDTDGKLYLAPLDIDPKRKAATGIPVEWFRQQLAECPAAFKLLILDACHAGSEKGDDEGPKASSDEFLERFKGLETVVTLASSTADQPSQIWDDKEQSLYSYWLRQALKGHADVTGDGKVDVDELHKYVERMVSQTADAQFNGPQKPVRILRSGVQGVPVVVHLHPQPLKVVLADMAEQLADALIEQNVGKVAVLEFANDTKLGELRLGADFGAVGLLCAQLLEDRLADYGTGKFSVIDRRRLQTAVKDVGFAVNDLGNPAKLKTLSQRAGGLPAIALGMLRSRAGRIVHLRCDLCPTEGNANLASVGGTAEITPSEWAMLGQSAAVKPEDYRPQAPSADNRIRPVSMTLIPKLDERAKGPHPMLDPRCPFRVKIKVADKERKGAFRGNDLFVPLRKGEVYEIWIENHFGSTVALRLLVDGLNTHFEDQTAKGIVTKLVAPRVNLDEARHWTLDPSKTQTPYKNMFQFKGFLRESGPQGVVSEFKVVDLEHSIAARQQFTDQIGLITAAFYAPKGQARGIGTGFGEERVVDAQVRKDIEPGNLLCVINVRYVDADALQVAGQRAN